MIDFANPEIGDASPSYESWMKCARDYVEFVKEDKTITECAKVVKTPFENGKVISRRDC
ncbi:MAG: hypothetical protein SPD93_08450 [Lachnospiraceae bacterium]|nr:hypothetical protein [Lachnospiraceae bacterium]